VKILYEIGNICRDYIVVYLFLVIWSMYSSDRLNTLVRCLRIMTRTPCLWTANCIYLNIYLRRKEILLIFFRHSGELPAKNQPLLEYL